MTMHRTEQPERVGQGDPLCRESPLNPGCSTSRSEMAEHARLMDRLADFPLDGADPEGPSDPPAGRPRDGR